MGHGGTLQSLHWMEMCVYFKAETRKLEVIHTHIYIHIHVYHLSQGTAGQHFKEIFVHFQNKGMPPDSRVVISNLLHIKAHTENVNTAFLNI